MVNCDDQVREELINDHSHSRNCLYCGGDIDKKLRWTLWFRDRWFCSAKCNNHHMGRLEYARTKGRDRGSVFYHSNLDKADRTWQGWLYLFNWRLSMELAWRRWNQAGIGFEVHKVGDDEAISTFFKIPGLSIYLGMAVPWSIAKLVLPKYGRRTEVYWFEDALSWFIWFDENSINRNRLLQGSFCPRDFVLGQVNCKTEIVDEGDCEIPMAEGVYKGRYKFETRYYSRRWYSWTRNSTWIDIEEGIPYSGKGENAWDCGDNALHGTGCEGHDVAKAVRQVIRSATESRRKYGLPSKQAFEKRGMMVISNQ